MSSLDEQSLLSSVLLLSRSPSAPVLPSGFMCIIMLSTTYEQPCLFPNILSGYFQQVSSVLVSCPFFTSHTKSLVTCSNFWRCIPTVMFSCASLFNLGSCELYRFRSHVWRQSNCMTMISQYAISFVHISLGFCGRINWQVIFAHGLIRHYTLPAEPYHTCFYYTS